MVIPSVLAATNQQNLDFNWQKDIWSIKTSPKLQLFLWSTVQGALPLGVELQRRGMNSAALCPRCKAVESATHVFFHCPFAKEVWSHIPLATPVHIAEGVDFKGALVRFRQALCLPPSGVVSPVLPWICWTLWTARNKLIFEDKVTRPIETATKGVSAALEWCQAQSTKNSEIVCRLPSRSEPRNATRSPPELSCFVDAAWDASTKRAGLACFFPGDRSESPFTGAQMIASVSSPLLAESLALRRGIEKALEAGFTTITILSDCSTLIRAITTKSQITELYGVLQDIHRLSSRFATIDFRLIPRSQNRVADSLAKQALKAQSQLSSVS